MLELTAKDFKKLPDAKRGKTTTESKRISRDEIYARLAQHVPKAIATLVSLLDSPNANVRLGAANQILNKTIPDLKSVEVEGEVKHAVGVVVLPPLQIEALNKSHEITGDIIDSEVIESPTNNSKSTATNTAPIKNSTAPNSATVNKVPQKVTPSDGAGNNSNAPNTHSTNNNSVYNNSSNIHPIGLSDYNNAGQNSELGTKESEPVVLQYTLCDNEPTTCACEQHTQTNRSPVGQPESQNKSGDPNPHLMGAVGASEENIIDVFEKARQITQQEKERAEAKLKAKGKLVKGKVIHHSKKVKWIDRGFDHEEADEISEEELKEAKENQPETETENDSPKNFEIIQDTPETNYQQTGQAEYTNALGEKVSLEQWMTQSQTSQE